MRPVRVAAVALIAAAGLVLGACSSDEPAAGDGAGSAASSPGSEASPSPSDSASDSASDSSGDAAGVDDFVEVDGYTLVALPKAASQAFDAATQNAPQIEDFAGRLVEKDGEQAGIVVRVGLDADQANLPNFERQFLPGFASGIAGAAAKPEFEKINGVNVVKIQTPGGSGTAYAWIQDAIATVLVFESATDAQAYAEGSLA
jgi:hypothetical protein